MNTFFLADIAPEGPELAGRYIVEIGGMIAILIAVIVLIAFIVGNAKKIIPNKPVEMTRQSGEASGADDEKTE